MNKKELFKKRQDLVNQQELENFESNLNRARSISVGTAFGGTTEIIMRGNGGRYMWCVMQPVEVTELIHQLAANIGCHIAVKPRDDFASWREWRVSEAEKKHLNGHAPFPNDMAVFQQLGASGFNQEQAEATLNDWLGQKEYEYVNGGATNKPSKRELKNIKESVAAKKAAKKTVNKQNL